MKKITLLVNGRKKTFSKDELTAIVEKHFSKGVLQKPTEGEWFEVKPLEINQELFHETRENKAQEETR